jgi:hypothetical protein
MAILTIQTFHGNTEIGFILKSMLSTVPHSFFQMDFKPLTHLAGYIKLTGNTVTPQARYTRSLKAIQRPLKAIQRPLKAI